MVRHIFLRQGWHSGQVLLCLVVNGRSLPDSEQFCAELTAQFPQIKTMPVELYGVIMQYPITAGPVLSLLLIIPTIVILVALRKYVGPEAIAKGYNMK